MIVTSVLLLASAQLGLALPACSCEALRGEGAIPGVVYRGQETLSLRDIAQLTAPSLWFSRDEPLLGMTDGGIPEAHPCDEEASSPVVYYQVVQIVLRDRTAVTRPEEDDPEFFRKVERMTLKFFFYYRQDFGLGGHRHDLEALELEVALDRTGECHTVRVVTASGLAHGSRWYSNVLEIANDTKFPLTLFVEEGKHASAPDRNADGYFTRGYDVTHTVNDAWGVRDVMGSGVLLTANYSAEMTKPRRPEDRIFPPEEPRLCTAPGRSSIESLAESLGRYELRPGNRVPRCSDISEERDRLISFMDYHGFGRESEPDQLGSAGEKAIQSLSSPDRFLSFSLRTEGRLGAALVFRGLDLRQGWIVPKLNVNAVAASLGLMYTPSASRFFDYYVAAGPRRQFEPLEVERNIVIEGEERTVTVIEPPRWDFYTETGIRVRAEIPRKARPFALGYSFAGVRIGVQALGLGSLDDIRLVFEVGAGAW